MKKILRYGLPCAVIFATSLSSCSDFLDVMPTGKRTEEQAYSDLESSGLVVSGLYDLNLAAMRGRDYQLTWIGTDELRLNRRMALGGDFDSYRPMTSMDDYGPSFTGAGNNLLRNNWANNWKIVSEANKVITALQAAAFPTEAETATAAQTLAEARFMRGLIMFRCAVLWGDIPITDPVFAQENGYGRQPQAVVWKFIIDDLRAAADVLPETQTEVQRPTKYSALAMLGKAYMQPAESTGLRDFAAADACFTQIINSGKYDLVPDYKDLWNNAPFEYPEIPEIYPVPASQIKTPDFSVNGKSESIFTIDFRRPGTNDSYINCWQWDTGSWEFESWFLGEAAWLSGYMGFAVNTFMYEDVNTEAETFKNYEFPDPALGPRPVDRGVGVWEPGDRRFDASIRYEWQYYTNQFTGQPALSHGANDIKDYRPEEGGPFPFRWIVINERKVQLADNMREAMNPVIKKFEDYRTDRFSGTGIASMYRPHKQFAYIRYSDVLLLHAECLNELGQLGPAIDVVQNRVRARAWGGETPPAWNPGSADEFRRMVMDERMRELCFEGWRRGDLARTGLFVEYVKSRNDFTKEQPGFISEAKAIWPIPTTEIVENAAWNWVQNPGYME